MSRSAEQLRSDALRIWRAGLEAVRSPRLVFDAVELTDGAIRLGNEFVDLNSIERIAVVGGGKAVGGMAAALERALGPAVLGKKKVSGWVNVPADCVVAADRIRLHAARPAGVNEPTPEAAAGVREMLRIVGLLGPRDLCIVLLSGGGSALLPAPVDGVSIEEKAALARELSARGATIQQLNVVRRELSAVKGGGLARACRAGQMASLIISDVPGDDLSLIASGPTVLRAPTPEEALRVLMDFELLAHPAGRGAAEALERRLLESEAASSAPGDVAQQVNSFGCRVSNVLIGNNALAVDAAGIEAERLGYSHAMISATALEGLAEEVARHLVGTARRMREERSRPDCLISGGEPTVRLAAEDVRGRGGRNQQLCLAALAALDEWRGMALVSGGTDGEDGPTNAAGACVDEIVAAEARRLRLDPTEYLARNDAYSFFKQAGGLLMTGPTQTNVCDLRVVCVGR